MGTGQIDWQCCVPGLIIQKKVFLIKKFRSKVFPPVKTSCFLADKVNESPVNKHLYE